MLIFCLHCPLSSHFMVTAEFSSPDRRAHSAPPAQQPSAIQSLFSDVRTNVGSPLIGVATATQGALAVLSTPPSMLFSQHTASPEEESFRFLPEYASFYAKNKALNPRLPPPLSDSGYGFPLDSHFAPSIKVSAPSVADLILGGGLNGSGASSVHSVVHSDAASLSGSEHTLDPGAVGLSTRNAPGEVEPSPAFDNAGANAWGNPFDGHDAHTQHTQEFDSTTQTQGNGGTRSSSAAGTPNLAGVPAFAPWAPPAPMHGSWSQGQQPTAQDVWAPKAFTAPPTSLPLPPAAGPFGPYAGQFGMHMPLPPGAGMHMHMHMPMQHAHMAAAAQGLAGMPEHMMGNMYAQFAPGTSLPMQYAGGHTFTPQQQAVPQHAPQQYMHIGPQTHAASGTVVHSMNGAVGSLQQLHSAVQHNAGGGGKSRGKRKNKSGTLDSVFANAPVDLVACPSAVVELARDQTGSRYVQFRFERGSAVEAGTIAQEMLADFEAMARDAFGNYAVQKIMDSKRQQCAQGLVAAALRDCVSLAEHVYGCRVVQKAIEVCDATQWQSFCAILKEHLMRFVYHEHGNHVVQKWVQSCPQRGPKAMENLVSVVGSLKGHSNTLALHMYGCRVLQRVVEAAPQPVLKKQLYPSLLRKAASLVLDQFGNFVLQHMLAHGDDSTRAAVAKALTPGVVKAAGHKCASNVLERLLECCAAPEVDAVVWQILRGQVSESTHKRNLVEVAGFHLLQPTVAHSCPVRALLVDRFGNYVLQKALAVAPMSSRVALADAIRVNAEVLTSLSFGQAIVDRAMSILIAAGILRAVGAPPAPGAAASSGGT